MTDQPLAGSAPTAASTLPPGSNTVTAGMRISGDWAWRILATVGAVVVVGYVLGFMSELTIPIAIALLLNALLNPARQFLVDKGWKPGIAATTIFLAGIVLVVGVITIVVRQFVAGAADLADQVSGGLAKVQDWLVNGPLSLSQDQIDSAVKAAQKALADNKDVLTSGALNTATSAGHVLTGMVLALFTLFFFLRDGRKVWNWLLRLAPERARSRIDGAADASWATLRGYVRATVLVAFVDALGIGVGIAIIGVPLALPLAAFVFLSSFIPIIGALLSGIVAVLVALVTVGPVKAIIVLAIVIAVQQLESHVLQPVLLGRAVSLHPLAVALSIAGGVILAGITGALLAVPLAATANAGIKYLARKGRPAEEATEVAAERRRARDKAIAEDDTDAEPMGI